MAVQENVSWFARSSRDGLARMNGSGFIGIRLGALFGPAVFGVTAAGVALPDVAADLEARPGAVVWVLTAHALALGIGTALFGRLSDAWGVRRTLLLGSAVLAAGALACLVAPSLGALVAARALLAAGSGALSAVALSLAATAEPERRPAVLAWFGSAMAVFSAGATLAGGLVTQALSWRLTLALPALALVAMPFCLPLARRAGSRGRVDVVGAGLLAAAVSAFLVLVQAANLGLTWPVAAPAGVVAALAGAALVRRGRTTPDGFVPRDLPADRVFRRAALIGVGVYGGLFATMWAAPQLLAGVHGWSVLTIGAWLLPGALVGVVLARVAGTRAWLLPAVAAVFAGSLVTAGIAGVLGDGRAVAAVVLVVAASLGFPAFSLAQVVITARMSASFPVERRGGAMGLLNLTFFVGGGIGLGVAGALSRGLGLPGTLVVIAAFPLVAALAGVAGREGPAVPAGPARVRTARRSSAPR
ncbi:MFS transporter [Nonomuraea spiralis]|uniref:MFS transporter n=1 Tax=Nonomuraea spiralis TaxID=46182 RepID=A0ABV5ITK2_9ACTN|nr:MFS transporter [Nonomuraea spiralis]GGS93014.1 tetracycline resistance protein [Nonomuraea spiralis]